MVHVPLACSHYNINSIQIHPLSFFQPHTGKISRESRSTGNGMASKRELEWSKTDHYMRRYQRLNQFIHSYRIIFNTQPHTNQTSQKYAKILIRTSTRWRVRGHWNRVKQSNIAEDNGTRTARMQSLQHQLHTNPPAIIFSTA